MYPTNHYAAFQARQAELMKKADIERLLREAKDDRPGTLRLSRRGATWLGIHLVRWGQKLERLGASESCQSLVQATPRSSSL